MGWFTGVILFLCIWWLSLFLTLPLWVRRDEAPEPGNDPGAPREHRMKEKFYLTTAVAVVIFGVTLAVMELEILDLTRFGEFVLGFEPVAER